jgi:CHAD domain-containing protein
MSFSLSRKKPVHRQLARIARSELRKAGKDLSAETPDQAAIHDARKRVKKARSVLRVLQEDGKKPLHGAAHALAALREVDANVGAVKGLRLKAPAERAILRGLEARRRRTRSRASPGLGRAKAALERAARSLPDAIERAGSRSALRLGTTEAYRCARDAGKGLTPESDTASFHRWRKRVKDLWYALRLLVGLHRSPRKRAQTLRRLEKLLGSDHDLATLRAELIESPRRYGGSRATVPALGVIDKRQVALRERALDLGRRALGDRPKAFRDAVRTWAGK